MSATGLTVYLHALSVLAPGLADWPQTAAVLRGDSVYHPQPLNLPAPALLPANERRRATRVMRLALAVAGAALEQTPLAASDVHSVFASSAGDSDVIDKICRALILPQRPVSPTHFHNSVHNAPAGYWSIATGGMLSSSSLSVYDGSFSAGLLAAGVQAVADQVTVLLVAYEQPLPPPLNQLRPLATPFACALLLSAQPSTAQVLAQLQLTPLAASEADETRLDEPKLEALRVGNPAARSLPLLHALAVAEKTPLDVAAASTTNITLPYLDHTGLQVTLTGKQQ